MATKTRNRVIYQSEALYVGQPSATGCHYNAENSDDAGTLYGLVKAPDSAEVKCILDWTEYWATISTPIDITVNAYSATADYAKDDLVYVEDNGDKWYFEAKQIIDQGSSAGGPVTVNADAITAGTEFTIVTLGDTDFTAAGADAGDGVGDSFTATGAGTGTGTASYVPAAGNKMPIATLKEFTANGGKDFSGDDLSKWSIKTAVRQLQRVQSANYSFAFNRQDVNQFGQLHRIDSVAIDPPTVSLDFSYYLTNGANEKLMGFFLNDPDDMDPVDQKTAKNFLNIKEQEDDFEGRNYFILTTPQGEDAVKNDAWDANGWPLNDALHGVISLGNGYVTNYGIEASVGAMPTANVTVEGLNLKSDTGFHNVSLPAVDNGRGTPIEGVKFSLPAPVSGVLDDGSESNDTPDGDLFTGVAEGFSCLRPGDIEMHLGTEGEAAMMNPLPAGTPPTDHTPLGCHVQSFSIDIPMGRTPLQRLGTPYAYTRPLDFPLTVNISVNAIVADLKISNVADHLFNFENHDLHFILREPQVDGKGPIAMIFYAKGAQLEGESFSSSIGDNKSVDITFTCQVGGPEDTDRGVMVAGSRGAIEENFADYFDPQVHNERAGESWDWPPCP
jgi:hypothetical protein